MNLESIITILAILVAILVAAKKDTPLFSFFKKPFFYFFDTQIFTCQKLSLFQKA